MSIELVKSLEPAKKHQKLDLEMEGNEEVQSKKFMVKFGFSKFLCFIE